MAQTVDVKIDPTGETVEVDLKGFKGKGCKAVAAAFDSLGKVTKDVKKPEYDQGSGNNNTISACR